MLLGIDFDNTLVCYDQLFHRLAVEGLHIDAAEVAVSKTAVRDAMRAVGAEDDWTRIQGIAYGPRILEARPFPGALDFLRAACTLGWDLAVVSHKTLHPIAGPRFNLHDAATHWLRAHGFLHEPSTGLSPERVYFEPSKGRKYERIAGLGCDLFIDDLPEFLADPAFPSRTVRVLFDPTGDQPLPIGVHRLDHWDRAVDRVGELAAALVSVAGASGRVVRRSA